MVGMHGTAKSAPAAAFTQPLQREAPQRSCSQELPPQGRLGCSHRPPPATRSAVQPELQGGRWPAAMVRTSRREGFGGMTSRA